MAINISRKYVAAWALAASTMFLAAACTDTPSAPRSGDEVQMAATAFGAMTGEMRLYNESGASRDYSVESRYQFVAGVPKSLGAERFERVRDAGQSVSTTRVDHVTAAMGEKARIARSTKNGHELLVAVIPSERNDGRPPKNDLSLRRW